MASDNRNEHSVQATNPEEAARLTAMVSAAVQEAVKGVFAQLGPTLQSMALTPEKLGKAMRESQRLDVDEAKIARELRESQKSREDEAANIRLTEERRAHCPHQDANMRSAICISRNFPDNQPRGICVICHDWIFPREWRIASTVEQAEKLSTIEKAKGKAYLVAAHKNYDTVLSLVSRQ